MSAPGFTPIQLYYSTTASAAPSSGNLANGELALNITDGKLYYKDNGGTVRVLAGTGGTGVVAGSNTQVQFNNNGVFGASSGLTFDGTTLTANALTVTNATTLSGGTANGVAYLNGSKVLTSGSALTFDGTNFYNGLTSAVSGWTGIGRSVWNKQSNTNSVGFVSIASASDAGIFMGHTGSIGVLGVTYGASAGYTPLAFFTNDAEQMRLTSTGLGIGTSSPSTSLTISKSAASAWMNATNGTVDNYFGVSNSASAGNIGTITNHPLTFSTNNTERMRLDQSGNLGLGVTPSAWNSDYRSLAVSNYAEFYGRVATPAVGVAYNAYRNSGGSWIYKTTNAAARYEQDSGFHIWSTAPSGTAGNAISFTQAMTLDASGNLGIATSSISSLGSSIPTLQIKGGIATRTGGIRLTSSDASYDGYFYADVNGFHLGSVTSTPVTFDIGNTERARIDSSGNLLVGTTSSFFSAQSGAVQVRSATLGAVTRQTALISSFAYSTSVGLPMYGGDWASNARWGIGPDSASNDSTIRIGIVTNDSSGVYWSGGYANVKGGTYTNASDYRIKKNVQSVLSPVLPNLMQVRPVSYNVIRHDDAGTEQSTPKEIGFIAHELQEFFPEFVTGVKDEVDVEGKPQIQAVDYAKFTAVLVKAIQEQQAIINQLKARLDAANL